MVLQSKHRGVPGGVVALAQEQRAGAFAEAAICDCFRLRSGARRIAAPPPGACQNYRGQSAKLTATGGSSTLAHGPAGAQRTVATGGWRGSLCDAEPTACLWMVAQDAPTNGTAWIVRIKYSVPGIYEAAICDCFRLRSGARPIATPPPGASQNYRGQWAKLTATDGSSTLAHGPAGAQRTVATGGWRGSLCDAEPTACLWMVAQDAPTNGTAWMVRIKYRVSGILPPTGRSCIRS